jgi:TDG/mug DNA glycosylase family protein
MKTVLPDVLCSDLRVVFCGTRPGVASAQKKAYYAGPGNKFWPTLHAIGLTARRLAPSEYSTLPTYGIGLTDMVKHTFGQDDTIAQHEFGRDALEQKILRWQPRILAFNGKRAASEFLGVPTSSLAYGRQDIQLGKTVLFVLPSTSGLAGSFWDIKPWRAVARYAQKAVS